MSSLRDATFKLVRDHFKESFFDYYGYMKPEFKENFNWWNDGLCNFLQEFYDSDKRVAIVQSPPQHGKSQAVIHFASWIASNYRKERMLFSSFDDSLGVRANKDLQTIFDSNKFKDIYGSVIFNEAVVTRVLPERSKHGMDFLSNGERTGGYFKNTTVGGAITGKSGDILFIDDPHKGHEEANSLTIRDKVWYWYNTDAKTRLSSKGKIILVLTRWHEDDLAGRIMDSGEDYSLYSFPAIATEDEKYRKKGEALNEKIKSLEFLEAQRKSMPQTDWESLYQQNVGVYEDSMFKEEWFRWYDVHSVVDGNIVRFDTSIRWDSKIIVGDTAQKIKEHNDFSVFQLWGKKDGNIYLLDQLRGKWEAPDLYTTLTNFMKKCPDAIPYVEDKVSGTGLIQSINREYGYEKVKGIKRDSDKVSRAISCIPQISMGYVHLPKGESYIGDFMSEVLKFNRLMGHKHDDQVDCMLDAIDILLTDQERTHDANEVLKKGWKALAGSQ